jgi:hypothetical protein
VLISKKEPKKMISKVAYKGDIFSIEFYVTAEGSSPAEDWLNTQPMKMQLSLLSWVMQARYSMSRNSSI